MLGILLFFIQVRSLEALEYPEDAMCVVEVIINYVDVSKQERKQGLLDGHTNVDEIPTSDYLFEQTSGPTLRRMTLRPITP